MASDKMDRGLDEIIADKRSNGPRTRRGGDRRRERQDYPRDGVKKSLRNEPRNLDSEWVHDRYEENTYRNNNRGAPRRRRESPSGGDARGTRLRVENIHYDLTEEDLDELFRRIGPITKLQLRYDRSGRSEGVAFVTYEEKDDAAEAVKQFDGANANGQPIRLTALPNGPSRNPFDTAVMPGKPLSERVSAPGGRSRSLSPPRRYDEDDAARRGIDRYVPGAGSRSRSPMPPRRGGGGGGRRPGARREGGGRDQDSGRGGRGGRVTGGGGGGGGGGARAERTNTPRPKKTQEELDAEMEDYFNAHGGAAEPAAEGAAEAAAPSAEAAAPVHIDDIDMIE